MMLLTAVLLAAAVQTPQAIRLEPGDYRWIPFTVKQVPTEVECRYEVLQGGASVHVELLPMGEFRAFNRGRAHETLAVSPDSRTGAFRRVIEQRGQYAVVVKNAEKATAVTVSLEVKTDLNPNADAVAQELPARRRLVVILASFALFFVIVSWSGVKLLRGLKG